MKAKSYNNKERCEACQGMFEAEELTFQADNTAICDSCYQKDAEADGAFVQVVEGTSRVDELVKKVAILEEKCKMMEEIESLKQNVRELMNKVGAGSRYPRERFTESLKCKWCDLDVSEHPYCGLSGRLHISSHEARKRISETSTRFPFPSQLLDSQEFYRIKTVLFFIAFYDVIGAPHEAYQCASRWLARHAIRFLLPNMHLRPGLTPTIDDYDPEFEPWCTSKPKRQQ
eukprot:TRINITY_DN23242_c0_g1_i1.p1 TRINITY_DN23242_c0_g1~~TRINITY_DN23242_c0_g1_i1.p1  ORF type:complete len:230 (+),score=46.58 TRINITY_DN23242_c0_g1_i1:104-793(+)